MATALVLGASGVSGWGVLDELRTYPTPAAFKRIIGLTYRPLSKETAMIPKKDHHRVELYSGFDLGLPVEEITKKLRAIDNIDEVGPVYFTAYTGHGRSHEEVIAANVALVTNSIEALEKVCPKLSFFTLQTGGKVSQWGYLSADRANMWYSIMVLSGLNISRSIYPSKSRLLA
jgi:hypothetical protein